jgi:glutaredoxin 3
MINDVIVYSKAHCPYCDYAKQLLEMKKIKFIELRVDLDEKAFADMNAQTNNARTLPQIIIENKPIGGFTDLKQLSDNGKLEHLINK